jgi:integrase
VIDELREAMAGFDFEHLTFLTTTHSRPFTDAGFGNWFAKKCIAAGVPGRAHGLRKAAAVRLAEAGASHSQIKAWTGHTSDSEVRRYIEAANLATLADAGARKMANHNSQLATKGINPLKGNT